MKYVTFLDLLGEPIHLNFESFHSKKTFIGGLLTVGILVFTIYCVFYFGIDMIQKKRPITRFTKQFVNESATNLTDFPFTFYFTNINTDKITDIDKYVTFIVRYYEVNLDENGDYTTAQHRLFVERCTQTHFDKFPTNYKKSLPTGNEIYCLNPNKILYHNGTLDENRTDLNIKNEMTTSPSNIVRFELYECDPVRDQKECYPVEKRKELLKDFFLILYLLDYYIDTSDYYEPNKPYIQSLPQALSVGSAKETLFKIKRTKIITDFGTLLEDNSEKYISQIENYSKDTLIGDGKLYSVSFGNTRIQDVYSRQYLKIQDLIAQIGGLIKFLLLCGSIVCRYYSNLAFVTQISNYIFVKVEETTSTVRVHRISILRDNQLREVQSKMNLNNINFMTNQNYNETTSTITSIPLEASLFDHIMALCNRKSKYNKKLYENIRHFVDTNFNALYVIKQLVKIDKLIEIFNKNPIFKECLEQKINYDTFNFESISSAFGDYIQPRQVYMDYQDRLSSLIS